MLFLLSGAPKEQRRATKTGSKMLYREAMPFPILEIRAGEFDRYPRIGRPGTAQPLTFVPPTCRHFTCLFDEFFSEEFCDSQNIQLQCDAAVIQHNESHH